MTTKERVLKSLQFSIRKLNRLEAIAEEEQRLVSSGASYKEMLRFRSKVTRIPQKTLREMDGRLEENLYRTGY